MHDSAPLPEITPAELKVRLDRGDALTLVDVREPREWAVADLTDYERVRIPVGEFLARMDELPQDQEIVVYCRSGGRSGQAVQALLRAGYPRVLNMAGGILRWREDVDPSLTAY